MVASRGPGLQVALKGPGPLALVRLPDLRGATHRDASRRIATHRDALRVRCRTRLEMPSKSEEVSLETLYTYDLSTYTVDYMHI